MENETLSVDYGADWRRLAIADSERITYICLEAVMRRNSPKHP